MQRNNTRAGDRLWAQFERGRLQLWKETAPRDYICDFTSHHQWCYREADGGQWRNLRPCSRGRTRKRNPVKATIRLREVYFLRGLLDVPLGVWRDGIHAAGPQSGHSPLWLRLNCCLRSGKFCSLFTENSLCFLSGFVVCKMTQRSCANS